MTIEEFENFATAGTLSISIKSLSSIPAGFELSALCSELISAIPSRTITLDSKEERRLNFTVFSETHIRSNHSCNISLYNTIPELVDHEWVNFTTTETQYEAP